MSGKKQSEKILVLVLIVALLAGGGYIAWRTMDESPPELAPRDTDAAGTTQPAPAEPTWTILALASPDPAQYAPAADPAVSALIERHNALQDRISTIIFQGACRWTLDGPGNPRPMSIAFHRSDQQAAVTCGPQRCDVHASQVAISPDSAMNVDALYLLMFRKYNPKGFRFAAASTAPATGPATLTVVSADESLEFDAATGQLLRAQVSTQSGPVTVQLADYFPVGEARISLPTTVAVRVPAALFPFPLAHPGTITLTINPASVQLQP